MYLLSADGLSCGYGHSQVLWDISFHVEEGGIVGIIGSNGAGKTTLLRTLSGLVPAQSGKIEFSGERIEHLSPHKIVERGLSQIPEGGGIFPYMTVLENLKLGAFLPWNWKRISQSLDLVFELFSTLKDRKNQMAGTLSGGERQMLGIGKGLMSSPKLLLIDEPSSGLAPKLVLRVFDNIKEIQKHNVTILLVEQNVQYCLNMASRAYVLENGRIVLEGTSEELIGHEHVRKAYLGI